MTKVQVVNQYFICLPETPLQPIRWDISRGDRNIALTQVYFGKVFETMEQRLTTSGLTFYLTWDTQQLPSYGDDVVVVVLGDEFSRIPRYTHQVRAVFKTLSMNPIVGGNPLLKPSYLNIMTLMQVLRTWIIRTPSLLNYWLHRLRGDRVAPIYDVPLGYYNQAELPPKPITERRYDLFFAGSLIADPYPLWSRRRWFRNPKDIARQDMFAAVEQLQAKYPELNIAVGKTNDFGLEAKFPEDTRDYSEKLMDSKICLAPRGSLFETFRFFEGLRYGCVVVTEALPRRWFYQGCPAVQLSVWSELEQRIKDLLQNEQLMQLKHKESLECWQEKCSEAAVGAYMAEKINSYRS